MLQNEKYIDIVSLTLKKEKNCSDMGENKFNLNQYLINQLIYFHENHFKGSTN